MPIYISPNNNSTSSNSLDDRRDHHTKPLSALPAPAPLQRPIDTAAKVFDKYQGGESQGDDDVIPDDAAVATAAAVDKTTAALPTFVPRAQRLAGSSGVNASHSTMPFQHTKRPPVRAVIVPREDDDDNGRTNSDDDD
eukprot:gene25157-31309_t